MPLMKALKTFCISETKQVVSPGREFRVSDGIAREYEQRGMAVIVRVPPKARQDDRIENRASEKGPLASPGGEIGADSQPSSSPAVQAPRKRRLKATEAGLDL